VPDPYAKLTSTDALGVVGGVIKNAEHILDEKVCHRESHAGESPHEEAYGIGKILIKRGETILDRIHPGVAMIKPTRMSMSKDAENVRQDLHIDQNDTQWPNVSATGLIYRS
jgi:hypothetical protein